MSVVFSRILIQELSSEPIPIQTFEPPESKRKPTRLIDGEKGAPHTNPHIMVCVTRQKTCERLIRQGAAMADSLGVGLIVVHVVCPDQFVLGNDDEAEALEFLFRLTNDYGAEMHMLRCENAIDGLVDAAEKRGVKLMIVGASPENAQSLSDQIKKRWPAMSVLVLDAASHRVDDRIA